MDNATLVSTREGGRVNLGFRVGDGIRRLPMCLVAPSGYLRRVLFYRGEKKGRLIVPSRTQAELD